MAMVDGDWTIDRATGNIRYTGADHNGVSPSYATVIEFHRWLQEFADDEAFTGDDELDIIDATPSDRSTDNIITLINGFNIDDTASEHLYDGSIIQGSGATETIYDGIVNFGNPSVQIQLLQNGTVVADDWWNYGVGGTDDTSVSAAFLTDSGEAWTVDEWVGYVILNVTDGSRALITSNTATTITGTLYGGTENDWDNGDAYLIGQPLNGDAGAGISHRFMLKVRDQGVDIDRRRVVGTNRTFGRTFGEFRINGTSRGNNVLALSDSNDLNNTSSYATVDGWTTITNTEGLRLIDIDNNAVNEEYYSEWDFGSQTVNDFYERSKLLQADGNESGSNLNGLSGEVFRGITHSFAYDTETGTMFVTNDEGVYGTAIIFDAGSGTFQVGEAVHENTNPPTWRGRVLGGTLTGATGTIVIDVETGTLANDDVFTGQDSSASGTINDATPPTVPTATAGAIRFFAIDDDGTVGNLYGQVLKGVAPVNNTRIYDDASTANFVDVNGAVTERTISTPFSGQSTGSALIGSYGLGVQAADAGASDTYFDLANNAITPPNNVTFTVSGLVSGEDRVLVTNDATGIDFTQMTLDTALVGAAETVVSVNTVPGIPVDTPSTGTIRIERNDGLYSRHPYSSYASDDFTITAHDFATNNASSTNNVFITYIDKLAGAADESFTTVFNSSRTLFIRVRDGAGTPIKTAETTGTLGSAGGSVTINRITDV